MYYYWKEKLTGPYAVYFILRQHEKSWQIFGKRLKACNSEGFYMVIILIIEIMTINYH